MGTQTTKFDPARYLTNGISIAAYLSDALENEDAAGVVDALSDVVRARGGAERLSEETSLSLDLVLRSVDGTGTIDFDAVLKVLNALGVRLSASLVA